MCACVRACVHGAFVFMYMRVRVCVRACVRACMRACCVSVCACLCVRSCCMYVCLFFGTGTASILRAASLEDCSRCRVFNLNFECCGHVHIRCVCIYKFLFCAGVGPPRHTQCATSPVCTILRVVGPLGRGRRDPGPAMRGPAPGAEVALGKPSLLRPSSLADFQP